MNPEISMMLFLSWIPAKAGIQGGKAAAVALDPRFRGGDDYVL